MMILNSLQALEHRNNFYEIEKNKKFTLSRWSCRKILELVLGD